MAHWTSESDKINRGEALNAVRDEMLSSASLPEKERQLVQKHVRTILKKLWGLDRL